MDRVRRVPARLEQPQLVEERRHGRQAPVDGGIGPTFLLLLFHESQAIAAVDGLGWFGDDREEGFQVVGVADPRVVCPGCFDHVQKMVDERGVRGASGDLALLPHERELHGLMDGWLVGHRGWLLSFFRQM